MGFVGCGLKRWKDFRGRICRTPLWKAVTSERGKGFKLQQQTASSIMRNLAPSHHPVIFRLRIRPYARAEILRSTHHASRVFLAQQTNREKKQTARSLLPSLTRSKIVFVRQFWSDKTMLKIDLSGIMSLHIWDFFGHGRSFYPPSSAYRFILAALPNAGLNRT